MKLVHKICGKYVKIFTKELPNPKIIVFNRISAIIKLWLVFGYFWFKIRVKRYTFGQILLSYFDRTLDERHLQIAPHSITSLGKLLPQRPLREGKGMTRDGDGESNWAEAESIVTVGRVTTS